jgi:hypothetical protein
MGGDTTSNEPWANGAINPCTESQRLYCFER